MGLLNHHDRNKNSGMIQNLLVGSVKQTQKPDISILDPHHGVDSYP